MKYLVINGVNLNMLGIRSRAYTEKARLRILKNM